MLSRIAEQLGLSESVFRQVRRYVLAGFLSYGLGLSLSALFGEVIGLREELAVAISLIILFVVNFWVSRTMVFSSSGHTGRQFLLFGLASLLMRSGEYGMFLLLSRVLDLNYLVALTVAMATSTVVKFFLYKRIFTGAAVRTGSQA